MPAPSRPPAHPPERCSACPLRQNAFFKPVTAEERDAIQDARKATRVYVSGSIIYAPGETPGEFYTLFDGWAFSFHNLDDGRRQIHLIYLPGDAFGLHPDPHAPTDHGVEAVTTLSVCVFDWAALTELVGRRPGLAAHLGTIIAGEQAALRERLTSVGRRSALERVAAFLLDVYMQAEKRGLAEAGSCPLPLSQSELGDALGLSEVHVNRTLRELRRRGSADISGKRLAVLDRAGLRRMSGARSTVPKAKPLF